MLPVNLQNGTASGEFARYSLALVSIPYSVVLYRIVLYLLYYIALHCL